MGTSGTLVGGVFGGVKKGLGWRGVAGGAGIGSVVGIVGWVAYFMNGQVRFQS